MSETWAVIAELGDHPILDTPAALQRLSENFTQPVPVVFVVREDMVSDLAWCTAVRVEGTRLLGWLDRAIGPAADHLWVAFPPGGDVLRIREIYVALDLFSVRSATASRI